MRPVDRGTVPQENGADKVVADFGDWRLDLLGRLGKYCCYCNSRTTDSLSWQAEHVSPQVPQLHPAVSAVALPAPNPLDWNNLLLACGPCNRAKSNNPCHFSTHFLPDYHNTHLAFGYQVVPHPARPGERACIVVPKSLTAPQLVKASATISLFKLDTIASGGRASDLRWQNRLEALVAAELAREFWDGLTVTQQTSFLPSLANLAVGLGFFSIWFDIYHDVPRAKYTFIHGAKGTALNCFPGPLYAPVVRVSGDL